jgi:hypothetical protein
MKPLVHSSCRKFSSKATQIPDLLKHLSAEEFALTAQFTCLKTGTPVGPDNNIVSPDDCAAGRPCYEEV